MKKFFLLAQLLIVVCSFPSQAGQLQGKIFIEGAHNIQRLQIRLKPPKFSRLPEQITFTDDEGNFVVDNLENGRYLLDVSYGNVVVYRKVIAHENVTDLSIKLEPSRDDYKQHQENRYGQLENDARKEINKDSFEKYLEARTARKKRKDYSHAVTLLEKVVEHEPTFYLAWYNYALALNEINRIEEANKAYIKAISLEPEQIIRDPSIYNAYGYFQWKKMNAISEAISMFQKCLELDPLNPRAKNNLEEARKILAQDNEDN